MNWDNGRSGSRDYSKGMRKDGVEKGIRVKVVTELRVGVGTELRGGVGTG